MKTWDKIIVELKEKLNSQEEREELRREREELRRDRGVEER